MPVIARRPPNDKTLKTVSFKLTATAHQTLLAYAQFLEESDPAYVVERTILEVLAGDKEFKKWQAAQ